MAEVIGIAASVITFGAFSVSIFKASKKIYKIAQKAPQLKDEMMRISVVLQSSATAIESCQSTLQNFELTGDDTDVLKEMRTNGTLGSLDQSIDLVMARLDQLLGDMENVESYFRIWSVIKWNNHKSGFADVTMHLECIKTTITMLMIVVILEYNRMECQKSTKIPEFYARRLEKENRVLVNNLHQQEKLAISLRHERRRIQEEIQRTNASEDPRGDEPILDALDSLMSVTKEGSRAGRWKIPKPPPPDVPEPPNGVSLIQAPPDQPKEDLTVGSTGPRSIAIVHREEGGVRIEPRFILHPTSTSRLCDFWVNEQLHFINQSEMGGRLRAAPGIIRIHANVDSQLGDDVAFMDLDLANRWNFKILCPEVRTTTTVQLPNGDIVSPVGTVKCKWAMWAEDRETNTMRVGGSFDLWIVKDLRTYYKMVAGPRKVH